MCFDVSRKGRSRGGGGGEEESRIGTGSGTEERILGIIDFLSPESVNKLKIAQVLDWSLGRRGSKCWPSTNQRLVSQQAKLKLRGIITFLSNLQYSTVHISPRYYFLHPTLRQPNEPESDNLIQSYFSSPLLSYSRVPYRNSPYCTSAFMNQQEGKSHFKQCLCE